MTGQFQSRTLAAMLVCACVAIISLRLGLAYFSPAGDASLASPFLLFSEDLQTTIKSLLTIPLGIVALVFIRQFIGMPTIGTFMPVLIGVSFRETGLAYGLPMFFVIVAVGIAFRFYFERLKLLLVPRLAAILVVVVITMLVCAYVGTLLGLDIGNSVSLFPIVIMAMTIERIVIAWEETGPKDTITHGAGSLFVAVLSYLIMSSPILSNFMFVFPETLLVLLALAVMMGRYIGFRLTEYYRFREVGKTA